MRRLDYRFLATSVAFSAGAIGVAHGQTDVTADITVDTTWTLAGSPYNLKKHIFVRNNAALTIEAGVVIASDDLNDSEPQLGGLGVARGSQLFVQGTQDNPVIFTCDDDVATWTGGDPKTGTWLEAASEHGGIQIMGEAYISEDAVGSNVCTPNASNVANLEGLGFAGALGEYGGGNDEDDSGTLTYLSIRYGGRVEFLGEELNALSLGGVGRGTDIHHIDIMNNVDDGIEIWGGPVNIKYFNIWNVGDDSFDVDQGWRGKAQFGLIVQGYSVDASQGSGVGDNVFELDGAEDCFWQPVTTANICNVTVVGQPLDGDHATAWRDQARAQFHNSLFIDIGDELVQNDNADDTPHCGYGTNGALSFAALWATPYNTYSIPCAPGTPADFYKAQSSGNQIEFTDCVFFRVPNDTFVDEVSFGMFDPSRCNTLQLSASLSPITTLTRGAQVTKGGKLMVPVTYLDPRPANDALDACAWCPADGFFTPADYRGAFAPGGSQTWLCGWTASDAFGFTSNGSNGDSCSGSIGNVYCEATTNSTGSPATIAASGSNSAAAGNLALTATPVPNQPGIFFHARNQSKIPFGNGYLCAVGNTVRGSVVVAAGNLASYTYDNSDTKHSLTGFTNTERNFQFWYRDPMGGGAAFNLTDAINIFIKP